MNASLEPYRPGLLPAEGRGAFDDGAGTLAHPEEMKAHVDLRIGDRIALNASARLTPAGLVCGAIAIAATFLSAAALARAVRAAREPREI